MSSAAVVIGALRVKTAFILLLINLKNLGPSWKMGLDFLRLLGKRRVCLGLVAELPKNTSDRELNYLRMNYRFEKMAFFHCVNFR